MRALATQSDYLYPIERTVTPPCPIKDCFLFTFFFEWIWSHILTFFIVYYIEFWYKCLRALSDRWPGGPKNGQLSHGFTAPLPPTQTVPIQLDSTVQILRPWCFATSAFFFLTGGAAYQTCSLNLMGLYQNHVQCTPLWCSIMAL